MDLVLIASVPDLCIRLTFIAITEAGDVLWGSHKKSSSTSSMVQIIFSLVL